MPRLSAAAAGAHGARSRRARAAGENAESGAAPLSDVLPRATAGQSYRKIKSALMIEAASITAALGSAKAILDLVKGVNDAHLATRISGEIANLQGRLIDVQQQALALQIENQNLHDEIRQLKAKLAETAESAPCPRCRMKGWRVESSEPDPMFGALGNSRRVYRCSFCVHISPRSK